MRTTVTLDDDAEALIRRRMQERGVSFKQAVNDAVRATYGVTARPTAEFRTRVVSMGPSRVDLDRALQIVADLEDDELVRRMRAGS